MGRGKEAQGILPDQKIFPICYSTARSMVKRLGDKRDMKIRPHDLRRHSATYASRNGIPLEVISKIILRLSRTTVFPHPRGRGNSPLLPLRDGSYCRVFGLSFFL